MALSIQLAEAVGDVMLLLHTRVRGEPAPLLEAAVLRLGRVFSGEGASEATALGVLQGLIDQAIGYADLTDLAILRIVEDLQSGLLPICAEGYGSAQM
jgi:hypothetical protein